MNFGVDRWDSHCLLNYDKAVDLGLQTQYQLD